MATTPLHRVRIQHLRGLLQCAQHGNMRAAADALAITQPAVTKIIKELEDIVGQPLVQRLRHGVVLTPAGESFARHARDSLMAIESALGSVAQTQGGLLRVGVLPSLAASWLQALWQGWREREPAGTLRVVTGRNAELLAQLQRDELDAVLGRLSEPDRMMDLRFEPLWAEPMLVAMHPDHPLAKVPCQAWQLLDCPVVLPLPGTAIRQAADGFIGALGLSLQQGHVETLTPTLGRALARDCGALWFTPESTVRADVNEGRLVTRPLPGTASEALGLFLRANPPPAQAARLQALSALVHRLSADWGR